MRYEKRNQEAIATLDLVFRPKVESWLEDLEKAGIDVLIFSAYRTNAEQERLWERGITPRRGGWSFHNYKVAIDYVPVNARGETLWKDIDLFKRAATIAKRYGMEWGGDWFSRDMVHLEYTQGNNIEFFRRGGILQPETCDMQFFATLAARNMQRGDGVLRRFKERLQARFPSIYDSLFSSS